MFFNYVSYANNPGCYQAVQTYIDELQKTAVLIQAFGTNVTTLYKEPFIQKQAAKYGATANDEQAQVNKIKDAGEACGKDVLIYADYTLQNQDVKNPSSTQKVGQLHYAYNTHNGKPIDSKDLKDAVGKLTKNLKKYRNLDQDKSSFSNVQSAMKGIQSGANG